MILRIIEEKEELRGSVRSVFLVLVIGLGLVVGRGDGIGALQPARKIELAAAVRAEGIVLAMGRLNYLSLIYFSK